MPWSRTSKLALSLGSSSVRAVGPRCVPWPWPRVWSTLCQTSLPFLLVRLQVPREREMDKPQVAMGGRVTVGRLTLPFLTGVCVCVWVLSAVLSTTRKLLQASSCTQHEGARPDNRLTTFLHEGLSRFTAIFPLGRSSRAGGEIAYGYFLARLPGRIFLRGVVGSFILSGGG